MNNASPQHLVMRDIVVNFNGFRAIAHFDFAVSQGELRCLIGPNGAGKTTALDLICGKLKPTSGDLLLDGRSLNNMEEHEIALAGVGRKFQVPSVFRELSVRENLDVAFNRKIGVFANAFQFGHNSEHEGLEKLAEFVGLQDHLKMSAGHLSHGQTQWLEMALLLAQNPEVILMDEPTAGMTSQETRKTAELFDRLKGKHTLVVVEHDMGFVKEIGDIISVMHQGKLLAEGTVGDIEQHEGVREAYLGSGGVIGA
jgi:urea transport system ATP-binding protein